jgi:hypothetical protein
LGPTGSDYSAFLASHSCTVALASAIFENPKTILNTRILQQLLLYKDHLRSGTSYEDILEANCYLDNCLFSTLILALDKSYCIRDISRFGTKRSEGILKPAKRFQKEAGGVPLQ